MHFTWWYRRHEDFRELLGPTRKLCHHGTSSTRTLDRKTSISPEWFLFHFLSARINSIIFRLEPFEAFSVGLREVDLINIIRPVLCMDVSTKFAVQIIHALKALPCIVIWLVNFDTNIAPRYPNSCYRGPFGTPPLGGRCCYSRTTY